MTRWVVVKAWGIDKNKNNKQDGGHPYPPFGLHLAAPYTHTHTGGIKWC